MKPIQHPCWPAQRILLWLTLNGVMYTCRLWEEGSSEQKRRSESFWQGAASMMNTIREWKNYPSRLGSELHNVLQDPAAAGTLKSCLEGYLEGWSTALEVLLSSLFRKRELGQARCPICIDITVQYVLYIPLTRPIIERLLRYRCLYSQAMLQYICIITFVTQSKQSSLCYIPPSNSFISLISMIHRPKFVLEYTSWGVLACLGREKLQVGDTIASLNCTVSLLASLEE